MQEIAQEQYTYPKLSECRLRGGLIDPRGFSLICICIAAELFPTGDPENGRKMISGRIIDELVAKGGTEE
jgi:hypothetical protein